MKEVGSIYKKDEVEQLYKCYAKDIYRYLLSLCRNHDVAADLLQTTFLQIMKGIMGFRNDCSIKTWIFTIARHEYIRWSKKNPLTEEFDESLYVVDDFVPTLINRERVHTILSYIRKLEEPHKSLMLFRLVGDLSFKEIALILDCSENWARVTFFRSKRKLLEELKEDL